MIFSSELGSVAAYLQIIAINIVLSGDNVIVIGMAAAPLPLALRRKAIVFGLVAATLIRVVFAVLAAELLAVPGLMLVGGLLLLWVCWKMLGDLRKGAEDLGPSNQVPSREGKTLGRAVGQIVVADISMSLDNVLAVAGAAQQNFLALILGLILSVALMGIAASFLARLMDRHRWIGWVGLAIVGYVAIAMVGHGLSLIMPAGNGENAIADETSDSVGHHSLGFET